MIRQGDATVFLSLILKPHERHQFRGKPVTEMLRALGLMDDVQLTTKEVP